MARARPASISMCNPEWPGIDQERPEIVNSRLQRLHLESANLRQPVGISAARRGGLVLDRRYGPRFAFRDEGMCPGRHRPAPSGGRIPFANSAGFGPHAPKSGTTSAPPGWPGVDQFWPNFGRFRTEGQIRPKPTRDRPILPEFGQIRTSARNRPTSAHKLCFDTAVGTTNSTTRLRCHRSIFKHTSACVFSSTRAERTQRIPRPARRRTTAGKKDCKQFARDRQQLVHVMSSFWFSIFFPNR